MFSTAIGKNMSNVAFTNCEALVVLKDNSLLPPWHKGELRNDASQMSPGGHRA